MDHAFDMSTPAQMGLDPQVHPTPLPVDLLATTSSSPKPRLIVERREDVELFPLLFSLEVQGVMICFSGVSGFISTFGSGSGFISSGTPEELAMGPVDCWVICA